jgi:bifunctional non-homologous end joining protein LigD
MKTENLPSIELGFCEGSSDKVYRACIEKSGDGYNVNFAYGRRGSALNTGSKTSRAVSYAEALDIYEKLVRSKKAKGYQPTGGGSAIAVEDDAGRDTGLRPQLLNPVDEAEAEACIHDNNWCAQEKFDGRRMLLVRGSGGAFAAANRKGRLVACPEAVQAAVAAVPGGPFVIDGELVGEKFHAFDLLATVDDRRKMTYANRLAELDSVFGAITSAVFAVVPTVFGASAKKAFVEGLRVADKEGVVFKDLDAAWSVGRPATGGSALKLKFWATCSCVVVRANAGKRSVELALSGKPVGNVTIPPNHEIPTMGQIVEIRYLYVTGPGGSLYQPVYLGVRDDVQIEECTFEEQRLKYKAA